MGMSYWRLELPRLMFEWLDEMAGSGHVKGDGQRAQTHGLDQAQNELQRLLARPDARAGYTWDQITV